jgi:hypothetical protein
MDYILVIPSFKRPTTLLNKTYALLKRTNIFNSVKPIIWLNEGEDDTEYKTLFPDCDIKYGGKSIVEKRNLIQDSYPEGTRIVMIDDDIKEMIVYQEGDTKRKVTDLNAVIQHAFSCCERFNTTLWGVYPIANPFFQSANYRTNLCYIVGAFFGVINSKLSVTTNYAEDFERSIRYFIKENRVLRLEFIGIDTNYYKEKGGLQETRTEEKNHNDKKIVVEMFPELVKLCEKRGRTEIAFIKSKGILVKEDNIPSF